MQYSLPLEPGYFYHIYNRGNGCDIFFEERNYSYFLKQYQKYITPVAETYAYCLLKNHFHFLVRIRDTPEVLKNSEVLAETTPVQQFSNFFNSYAKSINKAYDRSGSLFENRFGRLLVDSDAYFVHLVSYIHRNPQKHGFIDNFRRHRYSSYRAILHQRESQVKVNRVMDWFGNVGTFERYHRQFDKECIRHLIFDDEGF